MSDDTSALYVFNEPITAHQVLEKTAEILSERYQRDGELCNPSSAKDFLRFKLSHQEREVFAVMLLDSQHRLIEYQELFFGTVNAASAYSREIVKAALQHNASALILAHNHPPVFLNPPLQTLALPSVSLMPSP